MSLPLSQPISLLLYFLSSVRWHGQVSGIQPGSTHQNGLCGPAWAGAWRKQPPEVPSNLSRSVILWSPSSPLPFSILFFVLGYCTSLLVQHCCLKLPPKLHLHRLVWFAVLHWVGHGSFQCSGIFLHMSKYKTKCWFEHSALIHYLVWCWQHIWRE